MSLSAVIVWEIASLQEYSLDLLTVFILDCPGTLEPSGTRTGTAPVNKQTKNRLSYVRIKQEQNGSGSEHKASITVLG